MSKEVTISIDGVEVKADAGQTILKAADAAGIYIPRLCYLKDMLPGGHCRVCTVKANGRPTSACTFPVSEGLVIENDTEEMNALRRNLIEMLFVEGNHYCPSCEVSGDCELQGLAYRLGMLAPQFPYVNAKRELDASHPDLYIDRNRCILCGRCARASAQVDGKLVLGFEGRGIDTRISVDSAEGLGETGLDAADKAAEVCPTGAFVMKRKGWAVPVGQRTYDKAPIGSEIEKKKATA